MNYIVAEHNGIALKNYLIKQAKEHELEIVDLYNVVDSNDDYPVVAKILADKLKDETDAFGVAICGSGQGINIAMNRYSWVRSALPFSVYQAKKTRLHNDANCLSLGADEIDFELAFEMLRIFVAAPSPTEERHLRRIEQLS